MAGLVPAIPIHVARPRFLSGITGTSPVMTVDWAGLPHGWGRAGPHATCWL